jgi:hypothetical protein
LRVTTSREEVVRKGRRPGKRVQVKVLRLAGPDDFSDLAGTVNWKRTAQEYKDELRGLRSA